MFRTQLVLALACWTACTVDNPTTDCGNGVICPAAFACDVAHRTCVPPEDLEVCAGQEELAACTTRMLEPGSCSEGLCVPAACGNGIWDKAHGEGCDDGNTNVGDGCSSTCGEEACGNGVRDAEEECDDGNLRSHDGCDSQCLEESLLWSPLEQVSTPDRAFAAFAYDTDRERLIMFGGRGMYDLGLADTFEWNGVAWRKRSSQRSPARRQGAAMVYDAAHHVMVLFGGEAPGGAHLNDTWLWNGKQWREVIPERRPPGRSGHVMAYDPVRERVVLFGGETTIVATLDDTWEWDGTNWTQQTPTTSPSSRSWAAAAFDPVSNQVVMTTGRAWDGGLAYRTDTWQWNGTDWTQMTTAVAPRRETAALVVHPQLGLLLVGGGEDRLQNGYFQGDLRALRDGTWKQLGTNIATQRHGHVAFYDPHVSKIVVTSGLAGTYDIFSYEPWGPTAELYTLTIGASEVTYETLAPAAMPSPRAFLGMAYDEHRNTTVMFGGVDQISFNQTRDTWELADGAWTRHTTPAGPGSDRGCGALAYDPKLQRVVQFGGTPGISDNSVWLWDGTQWENKASTGDDLPQARIATALAYNPETESMFLFGGLDGAQVLDDTWTWDGATWSREGSMSPRMAHGMTYDVARKRMVVFGGSLTSETWTWTHEAGWQQLATAVSPPTRNYPSMSYDPLRDEVLLVGGENLGFDLWRLVGNTWTPVTAYGAPLSQRWGSGFVYDRLSAQFVLFGANYDGSDIAEAPSTYLLRWESETPDEMCGGDSDLDGDGLAGCADPDCSVACEAQ